MRVKKLEISAAEFKTHCLQLMNEVQARRVSIVIKKRGKPVARLVPCDDEPMSSPLGSMKGSVKITGDIVGSLDIDWEADG